MNKFFKGISLLCVCSLIFAGCGAQKTSNDSTTKETTKKEDTVKKDTPKEDKKEESMVLRLANNHAPDYPTSKACDYFAQLVEERTDGRIKIEVYHSAQLGEEKSTIEQTQFGGIDFNRVSISPLAEFSKDLNALQLPYLYRDSEHMWKVLNGEIGDKFLNSIEDANLVGLTWYDGGARSFYNSKKEIKSPADIEGLKIRVQESDLMMGLVKAVGGVPTPMPFADVYSALQTGVIDGAENNWPSYIATSHYEVAPYITIDAHTRVPEMIIASKYTMDKLSQEDQEIIKKAAKESTDKQRELWNEYVDVCKEKAKEAGVTITDLDSNKDFQDATATLYETYGADYKDVIEAIRAVQ